MGHDPGASHADKGEHMPAQSTRERPRDPARRSASRRGRSRQPSRWPAIVIGLIVVVLVLVAVLLYTRSSETISGITTFSNLARDHVDGPVTYPQVPPVGGPHNPVW